MMKLSNWKDVFAWSYLKSDATKTIILFCSCFVSFTSLLLASGFYFGSNQSLEQTARNIVDSSHFQVSKKEYLATEGSPLSLVRSTRPSIADISFIDKHVSNFAITNNYQRLFPGNFRLSIGEEIISEAAFFPVFSFQQLLPLSYLLVEGEIPKRDNLNTIVVNQEFADLLAHQQPLLADKNLQIEIASPVTYQNDTGGFIEDVFLFQSELRIAAVFKELSFLNTPKIFFSYWALEKHLSEYELEDISDFRAKKTTCTDLYDLIDDHHYLANYSRNLFALDGKSIEEMMSLSSNLKENESSISIESNTMMIKQTYVELSKAAIYSMVVFVFIAIVGTCSIMAIGAYSNYVSKKKESAILVCLGAKQTSIYTIYAFQSLAISLSALFVSILFAIGLEIYLNILFAKRFMINSLINIPLLSINGSPLGIIAILLFLAITISVLFTTIPLMFYKKLPLGELLREN